MNIEWLRDYCLSKAGVTESFPFGEDVLVFKVLGKMFALISINDPDSVNLKCDPEKAIELRAEYPEAVIPGYHMNKKLWNTVYFQGVPAPLLKELVDHSYTEVVAKLPKKIQLELQKNQ